MAAAAVSQHAWSQEIDSSVFAVPFAKSFSSENSLQRLQLAVQSVQTDLTVKGIIDERNALSIDQLVASDGVETTKFQHYFDGLEVIGSKAFHHMGRAGVQVRNVLSRFDLDTRPSVDLEQAASIARGFVGDRVLNTPPALKILPNGETGSARLIYWVDLRPEGAEAGRDVLLDAHTGDVIASISHHISIAPVHVYSGSSNIGIYPPPGMPPGSELTEDQERELMAKCQVVDPSGMPLMVNVKGCTQVVKHGRAVPTADASALRASRNSKSVVNYFYQNHRRDSYNGKGAPVVSVVHIGKKFDNAFWTSDLKIMAYGDGDGVETRDFTHALDVAGHEMTHGVISETANLIYMDESGALNEAYADFFGKMIANDNDWALGRKLFIKPNQNGFRNLANPGVLQVRMRDENGRIVSRPYPSKVSERFPSPSTCDDSNDYCWVHVNATIPGHASYLVVQAIGKSKAERLYYLTLTQYLNEQSNFVAAARATMSACSQIYDAATCAKVRGAFAQVGL